MNRHSNLPARCLLVLLGTILIAVGMTSVSLARTETRFHGPDEFIILKATSTRAYFTIDDSCEDIDENCTVIVRTGGGFLDPTNDGFESDWAGALDFITNPCTTSGNGENGRNKDFEDCWKLLEVEHNVTYTVEWPVIRPADDFDITPYCQRGDEVCAAELRVCYNARDCDDNDFERVSWDQVGDLWDEASSCLYDDDEDDVWECLDEALDDWLDDNMGHNDDYDDLEDEKEDNRGFTVEDYANDLNDVGGNRRSQRQGTSRAPTPVHQPTDAVGTRGPSFQPNRDAYLTVNFTAYLETDSPYQICNTTIGCITVATLGRVDISGQRGFAANGARPRT